MAFKEQETVRKQHRHNSLWGMYTVYVHFNRFIDHTINSYTTPYNLASSRLLWVWVACGSMGQYEPKGAQPITRNWKVVNSKNQVIFVCCIEIGAKSYALLSKCS